MEIFIYGYPCKVISLDDLIEVKRAMNRPKDKSVLQELLLLRERLSKT
jgi:hypothetical protein